MRVGELMQLDLTFVRPEATVKEVVSALATAPTAGLPVIDEGGHLVGVISRTDLIAAEAKVARDIMGPRPYTLGPAADVREAARQMHYAGIHRIYVSTEDRVLGVLSASDIVRAVANGSL